MKKRWGKRLRKLAKALGAFVGLTLLGVLGLHLLCPFPVDEVDRFFADRQGTRVLARDGSVLRIYNGRNDLCCFPVTLDEINPYVRKATLAIEDSRFLQHSGVDVPAVVRAAWSNVTHWRRVSGASTLTMQFCKQIHRRPRTLRTKVIEMFRAAQAERIYSKRKILEMYLNSVPYGGNVIGVEAAARRYFGKSAAELTLGESALLAGLPQSPSRLRPDRHPVSAGIRRDRVLQEMFRCGYITRDELVLALREPVEVVRTAAPFMAPHFCDMVRNEHPGESTLKTTIDRQMQHAVKTMLAERVRQLSQTGVHNGAVVVIENETGAVRSLCGSPEFFDDSRAGQVNAAAALRSPGSALKPFIYGMAFENGLLTPGTGIWDLPVGYKDYRPSNFDQEFRGLVRADDALADSLNLPAVRLLKRVGVRSVHERLARLGMRLPSSPDRCGLSLALGGVEVRLIDLTNAYAMLARLGQYYPCRLLENESTGTPRRIMDAGACFLVAESLSRRPLLPRSKNNVGLRIAWKTGTSNGYRDAWTLAYTPRYTVGVWLGNADGDASRALVGREAAAPLAARIVQNIHKGQNTSWFTRPESVSTRQVCARTGLPAGVNCPHTREDLFLLRRSRRDACPTHRLLIAEDGTSRVVEQWPAEVTAWLCKGSEPATGTTTRKRLRILSPTGGDAIMSGTKLPLRGTGNGQLYWFVNGRLFSKSAPGEVCWWPTTPGEHTFTCSDSAGRSTSVRLSIR